jgi:hypothetical protein
MEIRSQERKVDERRKVVKVLQMNCHDEFKINGWNQ